MAGMLQALHPVSGLGNPMCPELRREIVSLFLFPSPLLFPFPFFFFFFLILSRSFDQDLPLNFFFVWIVVQVQLSPFPHPHYVSDSRIMSEVFSVLLFFSCCTLIFPSILKYVDYLHKAYCLVLIC